MTFKTNEIQLCHLSSIGRATTFQAPQQVYATEATGIVNTNSKYGLFELNAGCDRETGKGLEIQAWKKKYTCSLYQGIATLLARVSQTLAMFSSTNR
jgi:hypothetical protein